MNYDTSKEIITEMPFQAQISPTFKPKQTSKLNRKKTLAEKSIDLVHDNLKDQQDKRKGNDLLNDEELEVAR